MTTRRTALKTLAATGAAGLLPSVRAQDDKAPITILVGAATAIDATARMLAETMRETLVRSVVVVPKLGAGQRLAIGEAKRAAPDGRTLVFTTSSVFTLYPHIYTKLDYDAETDFTPIAGVASFEVAIAVAPSSGITDYKQMVEHLKRNPGAAVGAAPGGGSLSHFIGTALGLQTGAKITPVAYKDSGLGLSDLMGGRLPVFITGFPAIIELHRAGRIRILAVAGAARSPLAPEIPTFREVGFVAPGTTSMGLFGPAKMPADLLARLHASVQPLLASAAFRDKLAQQAIVAQQLGPQAFAAALREERRQMGEMVKASGYVPEAPN